jgi:methionyl-tRNA formyltransferase
MKIVFMGNPPIACHLLNSLHNSSHDIVGVVSNAPKAMGRGKKLKFTAVGNLANSLNIPFIGFKSIDEKLTIKKLEELKPDLFVVMAFRILSDAILSIPKIGALNLHTSLLPKYRGAAPIQHSLINGDKVTGLTTFIIESKVDAGGILLQKEVPINIEDNFGTLSEKMANESGELVLESIKKIEKRDKPIPQNNFEVSLAPKISKSYCLIDWRKNAESIHNQIRALSPYPGAYTIINNKRFKILTSKIYSNNLSKEPGEIIIIDKQQLVISCKKSLLELITIQVEGKKIMLASDWIRGIQKLQELSISS